VQYHFSSVTKFELFVGATDPQKWHDAQLVIANMVELPFVNEVAIEAALIYQDLQKKGQLIGFRDIFIAATARFHNLPVKTLNTKDFSRIPGLVLL
jgi:predicted nucleic acid-binding protein